MMGIPPSEAGRLSPWLYSVLLSEWNARHGNGAEAAPIMSIERMRELGIEGV